MPQLALPRKAIEKFSKFKDPKEFAAEVFKQVELDRIAITLNRVLCAAYITSEVTRGGIIRPHDTVAEDIWQGKAALVLKVGPAAFVDSGSTTFDGFSVAPGDWVTFKVGNSSLIEINDYPCRIVLDHYIESRVQDPRMITS